jgi:ribokinase
MKEDAETSDSHGKNRSPTLLFREAGRPKIVVIGSLHMDLTVKTEKIPRIGETVLGRQFKMSPGGKGANQAVAAAKLGADVTLVGRVGADIFGREACKNARVNGIDTKYIVEDKETATGVALIVVDEKGNNIIAVASGADFRCCREDIDRAEKTIKSSDAVLIQLEIPLSVVEHAVDMAFREDVKVILNPSPAHQLPIELLRRVHVLTPNEKEAELLSGCKVTSIKTAKNAAKKIRESGVENVIITLGKNGAVMSTEEETVHVRGIEVNAIDTTGAGDAFCGTLAVTISSGKGLKEALMYSNCAGALATTKMGAQEALPTTSELESFMRNRGFLQLTNFEK